MKLFALILFILTYLLIILLPKQRHWVAAISAAVFVIAGILPARDVLGVVDFNVLLMLAGTMGTVSFFIESRMPNRLAEKILDHCPNVMWAVVLMSIFAGVVSAFVDNVATVLMIAPVGLAIAEKVGISPVGMLITIAVSSNLQGAATLVGDTTSIMLGGYADMNFMEFFALEGKPSIFFSVELGALATVPVIMALFWKERNHHFAEDTFTEVTDYVPTILLALNVILLICASFWPDRPKLTNGIICMGIFVAGMIYDRIKRGDASVVRQALGQIDYATLLLLAGLFVVVGGVSNAGIIQDISALIARAGTGNIFLVYSIIVWLSVLFSAFIDNIPYVATMLPVVTDLAIAVHASPYLLYFGLLTGATLGGNLTPIGASANITAMGILRKAGYEVKNKDFFRIGVPFTLVAVTVGYLFTWLVWG